LAGNYFVGTEDPGDNTVGDETQVVAVSSSGTVTGSGYKSNQGGLATKTASGAVTMGSNGIGNTGTNTVAITNGTRLFFIDQTPQSTCQQSPNPCNAAKITVVEKQ